MATAPKNASSDTAKKKKAPATKASTKKSTQAPPKKAPSKPTKTSKKNQPDAETTSSKPQATFEETPKASPSQFDLIDDALKAMEEKFHKQVLPKVQDTIEKATPVVMEKIAQAQETAEQLAEQALNAGRGALDKAKTAAKDHPVAAGAVGAAIGALAVKAAIRLFKKP